MLAWSRLGMIPLSIFNFEGYHQFFSEHYAAAVAFYPFCSFARGPHLGSILVLSAALDDWVDTDVCIRMANRTRDDDFPVMIEVFANSWHGFDIEAFGAQHKASVKEINPDGYAAGEGTLGYSELARNIAVESVRKFLLEKIE